MKHIKYLSLWAILSLTSCGTSEVSYYSAKKVSANTVSDISDDTKNLINDFLIKSMKEADKENENENLVFSPLGYFTSLASFYGGTYDNSSLNDFLSVTNISNKENIADIVKTIITNTTVEGDKYDDSEKYSTREKISNLIITDLSGIDSKSIKNLTDNMYFSVINKDENVSGNFDKWLKEEVDTENKININTDENGTYLINSFSLDTLFSQEMSIKEGTFKGKNCNYIHGDGYTAYHTLNEDYESVCLELAHCEYNSEYRGKYKIHFVKQLNNNSMEDLFSKYGYKELFDGTNTLGYSEKFNVNIPETTQSSSVDLIKLSENLGIANGNFEFNDTTSETPSYSLINYSQDNTIHFDKYGIRCSSISHAYSIPNAAPSFTFTLDCNYSYVIEDPNGFICFYGEVVNI